MTFAFKKYRRALKPDAQAFDEIRVRTEPRFKTSGLSGDEWRISAVAEFWRKGEKVHEVRRNKLETMAAHLAYEVSRAIDDGKAFFAGERHVCDQEGCIAKAIVALAMRQERCCQQTARLTPVEGLTGIPVRLFCERHRKRGDSDLTDCDSNYYEVPMAEVST